MIHPQRTTEIPVTPRSVEGAALNGSQDDEYQFCVVRFQDLQHLDSHHADVRELLSPDYLASLYKFPGADDAFPVFFYLTKGEEICCYLRTIPDQLTREGKTHRWAWSGDNYTHPQFRGRGLSTRLQRQATQYLHDKGIGRGSVYSTEVTLRTFEKLGFTMAGYAKRFLLLRTASPWLESYLSRGPTLGLLKLLVNPLIWTGALGLRLWNKTMPGGTACERLDCLSDPRLKVFLDRLAAERQLHFGMQIDQLNRKYEIAKRAGAMSAWLILDLHSGDCLAYLIIRERFQEKPLAEKYRGFRLMTLMDYAVSHADAKVAAVVVGHLIEIFFQSSCAVLEVISNNKSIHRVAARSGLLPVGKGMSFTYAVPKSWNWCLDRTELEAWPLTKFCGDSFTY
jgi:GNAT superfamily N-acetyltransferase